ncbi:TIGR03083 family protein [Dyadobacter sp. SG02]|uniref:maleylpyruvate isomerase N-terminal domain-containing protein n=1 Tax=Dyadobacter sp. SG02 TaxID=1855291 RepID=UPI0008D25FAD|nr:maleylpyruvate isomerase N-terminal domain-containing protein [Dyadobacter sp. SG02]SEJ22699.1 TIGR03083 family protein [Dyadobacter sp. SG02]
MIHTIHLFEELDEHLIDLLKSLTPEEWEKPTVARLWKVRDVAAHLLDGNIRDISMYRDGHFTAPDREINSYDDLVAYLNRLNADWVNASKRMSPALLTELIESTGKQYTVIMQQQDLEADAIFSVSWAGEAVSKNWFHIAREYTEKWHHQQQIRDAVGKPGIMTPRLFRPLIETFLRGLPHTYRHTQAPTGTAVRIGIVLDETFEWFLIKTENGWLLTETSENAPEASLTFDADTAWKLFTKAIKPDEALPKAHLTGNKELAGITLNLIAVMA